MAHIPDRLAGEGYRFVKIPEGKKYPFEDRWQKENNYFYDDDEIQSHLEDGGNYGVLCGEGSNDLLVIDCDKSDVEDAVEENLPTTFKVRSGSGTGAHFYYECPDADGSIRLSGGDAQGDVGDIKYTGGQVVGPSSTHPSGGTYDIEDNIEIETVTPSEIRMALDKWTNSNVDEWREIEEKRKENFDGDVGELDITDVVSTANLERRGAEYQGTHPVHGSTTGQNFTLNPNKNVWHCFRCDSGGGPLQLLAVRKGIISCENAGTGALTGHKFKETLRVAKEEYGLDVDLSGPEGGDSDVITTSKVDEAGIIAEEIYTDNGPKFATLEDGNLKIKDKIEIDGTTYKPIEDQATEKGTIKLATGIEDYGTTKELLEEIRNIIHKYVDVSEKYEKLASWYVVTTWGYDELSTLSYLRALGDTGTGKSRFLDVVGNMCYKPTFVSGAVTPAPIYRLIQQWGGTLIIDEGDMRNSDAKNEVVTILNSGFERDKPVIRCNSDDYDKLEYFETFGPKVIATRQEFNDKALESRCLTEKMSQTNRTDIPDQLPKEFYNKAGEIRNKLLKWRLDNKKDIDVSQSHNADLGNVEPRLKQATRGFLAIFKDDEIRQELYEFLKSHQRELIEQRSQTWEGMIVNTIYDKYKNNNEEPIQITPGEIAGYIEENMGENRINAGTVGKKLRSLNLETERKRIDVNGETKQRRVLNWNMNHLTTLFERYVPEYVEFVTAKTDVTVHRGQGENIDKYKGNIEGASPHNRHSRHTCHTDDFDDTLEGEIKGTIKELDEGDGVHIDDVDDNMEVDFSEIMDQIDRMKDNGVITKQGIGIYSLNER